MFVPVLEASGARTYIHTYIHRYGVFTYVLYAGVGDHVGRGWFDSRRAESVGGRVTMQVYTSSSRAVGFELLMP